MHVGRGSIEVCASKFLTLRIMAFSERLAYLEHVKFRLHICDVQASIGVMATLTDSAVHLSCCLLLNNDITSNPQILDYNVITNIVRCESCI